MIHFFVVGVVVFVVLVLVLVVGQSVLRSVVGGWSGVGGVAVGSVGLLLLGVH